MRLSDALVSQLVAEHSYKKSMFYSILQTNNGLINYRSWYHIKHCYQLVPHQIQLSTGTTPNTVVNQLVPHQIQLSTGTTPNTVVNWYHIKYSYQLAGTTPNTAVNWYHTKYSCQLVPHQIQLSTGTTPNTIVNWYHTKYSCQLVPRQIQLSGGAIVYKTWVVFVCICQQISDSLLALSTIKQIKKTISLPYIVKAYL